MKNEFREQISFGCLVGENRVLFNVGGREARESVINI